MRAKDYMARDNSLANEAAHMFGSQTPADLGDLKRSKKERLETISIFDIMPDPTQPRRALPSVIRQHGGSVDEMLGYWLSEVGHVYPIGAIMDGDDIERPETDDPLTLALLDLIDLANSIRRDGLTNPITLVKDGERYIIETGERRWLAYCLLSLWHDGGDKAESEWEWGKIPARIVETFSRWRQAAENNTRSALTAIAMARQFGILLMDLYAATGADFAPLDAFENEQDFYAQVADGEEWRIPRGRGEDILTVMGLKNTQQLRQYRALLRLPAEVWQRADDERWTEFRIRQEMNPDSVSAATVSDEIAVDEPEEVDEPPTPSALGEGGKPQKTSSEYKPPKQVSRAKPMIAYTLTKLAEKPPSAMSQDERDEIRRRLPEINALLAWLNEEFGA